VEVESRAELWEIHQEKMRAFPGGRIVGRLVIEKEARL